MNRRNPFARRVLPGAIVVSFAALGPLLALSCANPKPPVSPDTAPMGVSPEGGTDTPTTPLPGAPSSPSLGSSLTK